MIMLSVKKLSVEYKVSYGVIKAVKNISFNVKKGETLAVVGRSGSGKSTVASAIIGLTDIDGGIIKSGSVIYDKKDLLKLPFEEKRKIRGNKISMIFQDPQSYLNPVMKVGRQIEEAFTAHNPKASREEIKAKVIEVLKKVNLTDDAKRILDSYPHRLSGGQKQRILIAMAIINNPEILIADEPTTGLDAAVQKQVLDLLKELKEKLGLTMIIITHNMKVAQKYSDTLAVMHDGEIVEMGATAKVFKNPKCEYTKLLIND